MAVIRVCWWSTAESSILLVVSPAFPHLAEKAKGACRDPSAFRALPVVKPRPDLVQCGTSECGRHCSHFTHLAPLHQHPPSARNTLTPSSRAHCRISRTPPKGKRVRRVVRLQLRRERGAALFARRLPHCCKCLLHSLSYHASLCAHTNSIRLPPHSSCLRRVCRLHSIFPQGGAVLLLRTALFYRFEVDS